MTDIHFRVTQDTGELMAFDDNDEEINRCIIEDWIGDTSDNFFEEIPAVFRTCCHGRTVCQLMRGFPRGVLHRPALL